MKKNEKRSLNTDHLKDLITSATIKKDASIDKLIGGFSQAVSIGIEDTISDGQTNNCDGVNCRKYCGADMPQLPFRS